eukprot:g19968.t1
MCRNIFCLVCIFLFLICCRPFPLRAPADEDHKRRGRLGHDINCDHVLGVRVGGRPRAQEDEFPTTQLKNAPQSGGGGVFMLDLSDQPWQRAPGGGAGGAAASTTTTPAAAGGANHLRPKPRAFKKNQVKQYEGPKITCTEVLGSGRLEQDDHDEKDDFFGF